MKHALARVNLADHGLVLLSRIVEDLSLFLVGLSLSEIQREPVGELDTVDRLSHAHLLECS